MRMRRWAYRKGHLKSRPAGVPVICVGNITTGGTGKTPVVIWVIKRLKELGKTPAVLTRGYKSRAGRSDEAEMLSNMCETPVIVCPDRLAGARAAVESGADICVMDDGFQHRRLKRDLDIVLIDATNPFGFGKCLPRGLLREPVTAMKDAHAIIVTRSDEVPPARLDAIHEELSTLLAPGVPICQAIHKPRSIIDDTGAEYGLHVLAGRKVLAFCGLGNPESFFQSLRNLGARLIATKVFEDHAEYGPARIEIIKAAAQEYETSVLITTQKDAVKLRRAKLDRPVWSLAVEMDIVRGREELLGMINKAATQF